MTALVHLAWTNAVSTQGEKTGGQGILHSVVLLGCAHDVFCYSTLEWLKHTVCDTKRTYRIRWLVGSALELGLVITIDKYYSISVQCLS